ncbi:serine/threonine-protein kinase [Spirillospora sp. NPDC048911]|uniref:serine/threonine-protein kinase n=1 Tax=Spirillospora sp. NPDC048911 TaxID=3364527 RepID=UPI0037241F22
MGSRRLPLEPLSRQDPVRIGAYVLLGRLGLGAMGRVYLGRSAAGRLVAVKTIRHELADEGDFRARFRHEITAAGRVSGAFTAAVIEADPDAEVPWLATSYVPAPSLDRLVRACGPLPVPAVRWLAAGCAEALESIHRTGLLHRDFKPSNVLVSADGPRVIDFGVARAAERSTLTATHQAVGTPAYMAPEQARNVRKTVPASDVFALGSTMLFAATGHPPYEGDSVTEILVRLATEPPDLTGLPAELAEVVESCLEREPERRPTAAALLPRLGYDSGLELPAVQLPRCALALIEDYRQWPQRPAAPAGQTEGADADADDEADDYTFASPTSSPEFRPALAALRENAAEASPSPGAPAGPVSDPGARSTIRWRSSRAARRAMVLAVAAALVVLGGAAGAALNAPDDEPARQPDGLPGGGRPLAPPPPASGAGQRADGDPRIQINQPLGDGHTVFVVHGRGWTPGRPVTIRLDKGRASPARPVVDIQGTFNYAVNQSHEFYPGKLPPGVHEVVVTASGGGAVARAKFTVNNL